jgi:hypothetical protein
LRPRLDRSAMLGVPSPKKRLTFLVVQFLGRMTTLQHHRKPADDFGDWSKRVAPQCRMICQADREGTHARHWPSWAQFLLYYLKRRSERWNFKMAKRTACPRASWLLSSAARWDGARLATSPKPWTVAPDGKVYDGLLIGDATHPLVAVWRVCDHRAAPLPLDQEEAAR